MGPEAPLRPAPEIVGEPDRCDRRDGRHREPDHGADERQPEPAVVHGLRPAGEHELGELAAAVREPAQVTARRAMLELELDLLDLEPGADRVDRHPRLDPEAHRDREDRGARPRGEPPLARERLARDEAAAQPDQRAGRPSSRARSRRPPWRRRRRSRDPRSVSASASKVAAEIRVAEEQRPGLELLLGQRQRLTLATARRA